MDQHVVPSYEQSFTSIGPKVSVSFMVFDDFVF